MNQRFQYRERNWLSISLTILIVITCLRVWLGPVQWEPRAEARIPDAGKQRQHLVEEIRQTNQLLKQILAKLENGTFNVNVKGTDNPDKRS
ncbi:MAG: hypothetical protein ACPGXK_12760 [Phycisphaerae bacterium]